MDKCVMCGEKTNGTYGKLFPVCFEHYEDGTLKEWLKENQSHIPQPKEGK